MTTTAITHWSEAASDEAGGWRGAGSADQHLFDPAGNWLGIAGFDSVIQFDGHLWEWYWNGDTYLSHFNNLYSANGVTNHFGTEVDDALFYPWGQHWEHGENFADLPYYDPKTNDIFAPLRVDSPGIGRWLSPDPIGEKAVRLDDPQTWNMYAYVRDNPTTLTDPSGTCEGNDAVPKTTGGEMNGSRDEGLCQSRNLNAEQGQGKGQVRTTAGVPVGNSPENHAAADKNPAVLKVTSSSDGKTGGVIQYDLTKAPGDPQNYQISQAESYAPRSGDPSGISVSEFANQLLDEIRGGPSAENSIRTFYMTPIDRNGTPAGLPQPVNIQDLNGNTFYSLGVYMNQTDYRTYINGQMVNSPSFLPPPPGVTLF